jgi:hypothetical protein
MFAPLEKQGRHPVRIGGKDRERHLEEGVAIAIAPDRPDLDPALSRDRQAGTCSSGTRATALTLPSSTL